jgi:hypothetical protein
VKVGQATLHSGCLERQIGEGRKEAQIGISVTTPSPRRAGPQRKGEKKGKGEKEQFDLPVTFYAFKYRRIFGKIMSKCVLGC